MARRMTPEGAMTFTVPMIPPSLNHYKVRYRNGRTVVSTEAKAFKEAIMLFAPHAVEAKAFSVSILIVLGKGERGDVDNFPKLVCDGLADAGVFRNLKGEPVSDAHVDELYVLLDKKSRPERGRTVVTVKGMVA